MADFDFSTLLARLEAGEFDLSLRHNAAVAQAVHGGTDLVLEAPVDFDPRRDYWHPPERRLMVAFFASRWPAASWPVRHADAISNLALHVARALEARRRAGGIPFVGVDYERGGGLASVMAPVRHALAAVPDSSWWDPWRHGRGAAVGLADALLAFCDRVIADGFEPHEARLGRNLRLFAYLSANNEAELVARQRFFLGYAHALTSGNAYRRAGAQYMGPVYGNTPTRVLLECLAQWRTGTELAAAPLLALGRAGAKPVDRSHTVVVQELWSTLNLHQVPWGSHRLGRELGLGEGAAPASVGARTRAFLAGSGEARARAAARLARVLADARPEHGRPFAVARCAPGPDDSTSLDARALAEIAARGRRRLLRDDELDRAATMLHLALDAWAFAEVPTASGAAAAYKGPGPEAMSSPGSRPPEAREPDPLAGKAATLTAAERVWLYAPGPQASNWEADVADGVASVGYNLYGDLSPFESAAQLADAVDGEAASAYAAATAWRFAHAIRMGDPIVARRGRRHVIGIGVVSGKYAYRPERPFAQTVPVRWVWRGDHRLRGDQMMAMGTLAESAARSALVAEVAALVPGAGAVEESLAPERLPAYTNAHARAEVFLGEPELDHLVALWKRKKNLILQGPPGVGKTFVARRLAYLLMGRQDDERVEVVQFHPSYGYEQFVCGYCPDRHGRFRAEPGPLIRIARRAQEDLQEPYVLLIDEINRGHLGRILGEAMMLLEADKRGPEFALRLAYRVRGRAGGSLWLPPNLYIIGTMNTADRSLALLDYALRRRFALAALAPAFLRPDFEAHLAPLGPERRSRLLLAMKDLNEKIENDPSLGSGFALGHSYFCQQGEPVPTGDQGDAWIQAIVEHEIVPLLDEYWADAPAARAEASAILKGVRR